jgi:hypothetical protein
MTEKEFVIWLHGFLEISGVKTLDENQLQVIKDHLNVFFTKVTPDRKKQKNTDSWTDLKKLAEERSHEQRKMRTPPPPLYPPLYPHPSWPTIPKVPGNTPLNHPEIWCSDDTSTQHPKNETYC